MSVPLLSLLLPFSFFDVDLSSNVSLFDINLNSLLFGASSSFFGGRFLARTLALAFSPGLNSNENPEGAMLC
jgi:hypothetical protein